MKTIKFKNNNFYVEYDGNSIKANVKGVKESDTSHPAVISFLLGKKAQALFTKGCAARGWENPLPKLKREALLKRLYNAVDPNLPPKYNEIVKIINTAKTAGLDEVTLCSMSIKLSSGTAFIQGSVFMKDPKAAILPPHTHLTMKGGTLIEHPKSSDECVITTVSCYPGKLFITIYYKRLCRTLEDVKFLCEEIAQEWEATNNYYNTLLEKVEDKLIY